MQPNRVDHYQIGFAVCAMCVYSKSDGSVHTERKKTQRKLNNSSYWKQLYTQYVTNCLKRHFFFLVVTLIRSLEVQSFSIAKVVVVFFSGCAAM